jgi:hypothetical protein
MNGKVITLDDSGITSVAPLLLRLMNRSHENFTANTADLVLALCAFLHFLVADCRIRMFRFVRRRNESSRLCASVVPGQCDLPFLPSHIARQMPELTDWTVVVGPPEFAAIGRNAAENKKS